MFIFGCVGMDNLAFSAVNLDARAARSREDLCGCRGEGEDVGGVGIGDGVGLEVLFRLLRSVLADVHSRGVLDNTILAACLQTGLSERPGDGVVRSNDVRESAGNHFESLEKEITR